MTPTRIVVHNTANDASAENEIKYMQSNNNQVSFHYAVDDKHVIQGIDTNRNAWHAGDGAYGNGNRQGIAIEICYSKSGGERFVQAEKNAAAFIAQILHERGWAVDRVNKHQDYSGKYCPHRTLDMGWQRFINMVSAEFAKLDVLPDTYVSDGLTYQRCNDFKIIYHDKNKRKAACRSYINGGFFAYYAENGKNFTLPVGNLVCDCSASLVPTVAQKYVLNKVSANKLRIGCDQNQSPQFRGKKVATLVVPKTGTPYIDDINAPPADCLYAISGVPTVRHGDDVDYYGYVKPQGWDESCMYATYRNWLGIRNGEIWLISGKTSSLNYIYGMEFWNKVKDEGFDDIICLDGGGSYYRKVNGRAQTTAGTRSVNNIISF